jgi:hypothetical protein
VFDRRHRPYNEDTIITESGRRELDQRHIPIPLMRVRTCKSRGGSE